MAIAPYAIVLLAAATAVAVACNDASLSGGATSTAKTAAPAPPATSAPAAAPADVDALATLTVVVPDGATLPPTTAVVESLRNFVLPPGFTATSVPARVTLEGEAQLLAPLSITLPVAGPTAGILVSRTADCYVIDAFTAGKTGDAADVRFTTTEHDAVYTGVGAGTKPAGCVGKPTPVAGGAATPTTAPAGGNGTTTAPAGGSGDPTTTLAGPAAPTTEADAPTTKADGPTTTLPAGPKQNRAFVTTATFNGNLGGLAGADTACNAEAQAQNAYIQAGMPYLAVLSTTAAGAASRFPELNDPEVSLYNQRQLLIALAPLQRFFDGGLEDGITSFPLTDPYVGAYRYWTGFAGTSGSGLTCGDWTNTTSGGLQSISSTDPTALSGGHWLLSPGPPAQCSSAARLLCISKVSHP